MRAVVFLLVLGNLIFFAYARGYFGSPAAPDRERLVQQLSPEKVVIVGRGEAPVLPAPPAGAAVPASVAAGAAAAVAPPATATGGTGEACLAWPPLGAKDLEAVAAAVKARSPGAALLREPVKVPAERFLVRIPGLANKAAADKKAGEVRGMGITDFEVVADGEEWAVALGLYSSAESADARLAAVRKQGVRSAVVQQKTVSLDRTRLQWRGPAAAAVELRQVLAQAPAGECTTATAGGGAPAAPAAAAGDGKGKP